MKKILIYKQDDNFVIERINEFNHSTKRFFITEQGLFEGLDGYKEVIEQYQLDVSEDLRVQVINHLNK